METEVLQFKPKLISSDEVLQVAGNYDVFEGKQIDSTSELTKLNFTLEVFQSETYVGVEHTYDDEVTCLRVNYPLSEASYWDPIKQCYKLSRAVGKKLVTDIITPVLFDSPETVMTVRLTWEKNDFGHIVETWEDFNPLGKLLQTSYRTLIPKA